MALVVPDVAEILMLQYLVNLVQPGNRVLHLYTNNYVPTDGTTLANLTEANQNGYSPITLVGSGWTVSQSAGVTTALYSEQTFPFLTGATLTGYYVTTTQNALLWVEIFSNGPFTLPDVGGEIAVTPTITLD
jgi:hypothetical protein